MTVKNIFTVNQQKLFIAGVVFFFLPKLVNTYFLMPFPGSMDRDTMTFSYLLDKVDDYFLYTGAFILLFGSFTIFRKGTLLNKTGAFMLILAAGIFYYFAIFEFNAEEMFKEPGQVSFKKSAIPDYEANAYVIGVSEGTESKAYPVKYLAYHHKIHDKLNNKEILVTYCSMCRSARVFSPVIAGENVSFRLVGARHYNAILEDSKTKSWWYQATGEAAAGPLKGEKLKEIPSEQLTWKSWASKHPETLLMQPDPGSTSLYKKWFDDFDKMRSPSDTIIDSKKIWVAGIVKDNQSAYYTIPELIRLKAINSKIGDVPVVICIENDSLSTHVWERTVKNEQLFFNIDSSWMFMTDSLTGSSWNMQGICIGGKYLGEKLRPLQHYNEYMRSWKQFH